MSFDYYVWNRKYFKERKLKYPWKQALDNAKQRCENPKNPRYNSYGAKGIKFTLSYDDGEALWNRDKAFLMKEPSLDRLDVTKDYTFNNCQFIEKRINSGKDKERPVLQFDLLGNFIKEWKSGKIAGVSLGISRGHICAVCKGLRNKTVDLFGDTNEKLVHK